MVRSSRTVLVAFALITLASTLGHAQSLVVNHDFETLTSTQPGWCPFAGSQIFLAAGWQSPAPVAISSPDYFHACGNLFYRVPTNTFGHEPDNAGGQAYASIVAYHQTLENREYIQASLTAPLVGGVAYEVSFDVSLAEKSGLAIDNIGAFLGTNISTTLGILSQTPQVTGANVVSNPVGWTTITDTFVANGGEDFITLGVFGPQADTTFQIRAGAVAPNIAVYYVDNVVVRPLSPDGRRFVTSFDDHLLAVDTTTGPTCDFTVVGPTQDASGGPLRHVRGLAFDGMTLWGLTRGGDLVRVDPHTAETEFVYSLTSAVPQNEYWTSLAFDGANTLYASNVLNILGPPQLVALDISTLPPTETFIGTPSTGPGFEFLFAMALYPLGAPTPPPTYNGAHPALGNLYGESATLQGAPLLVNKSTAALTALHAPTFPPFSIQGFDFNPTSGVLEVLGRDFNLVAEPTDVYSYDFTAQGYTKICTLSGALGLTAPLDSLTGVGMTFVPPTLSVQNKVTKLCVIGLSTGVPWEWKLGNFTATVPALAVGATEADIVIAFVQSLKSMGFKAWVDNTDPTCLNVLSGVASQLSVGPVSGTLCIVTNNPSGCAVNPTIIEVGFLPVPHPVAVDTPVASLLDRVRVHPNPFNPVTTVSFLLGRSSVVRVEVLDVRGARIRLLADRHLDAGHQEFRWDGRDGRGVAVASGAYLLRVEADGEQRVRKMALIR